MVRTRVGFTGGTKIQPTYRWIVVKIIRQKYFLQEPRGSHGDRGAGVRHGEDQLQRPAGHLLEQPRPNHHVLQTGLTDESSFFGGFWAILGKLGMNFKGN